MKKLLTVTGMVFLLAAPASAGQSDEDRCTSAYLKSLNKVLKLYTKAIDQACRRDLTGADLAALGSKLKVSLDKVADRYNQKTAGLTCDADLDDIGNQLAFSGAPIAELDSSAVMLPYGDPVNTTDVISVALAACT